PLKRLERRLVDRRNHRREVGDDACKTEGRSDAARTRSPSCGCTSASRHHVPLDDRDVLHTATELNLFEKSLSRPNRHFRLVEDDDAVVQRLLRRPDLMRLNPDRTKPRLGNLLRLHSPRRRVALREQRGTSGAKRLDVLRRQIADPSRLGRKWTIADLIEA